MGLTRCYKNGSFLPAGQLPVLELLRCPILRFFAPKGWHDARINVKFGTAEGTAVPNFTLQGGYLGISGPKKHENLPKNFQSCKLFAPNGRIPCPILVKFMCYVRLTSLCDVFKFGASWFTNDKFVGRKVWWVIFPTNFWSLLAPKLLVGHKKSRWAQKWYGHALSMCQVWWRSADFNEQYLNFS